MIPKINHIRYATLTSLLKDANKLTRSTRVNFFVNLEPIFRRMMTKKNMEELKVRKDDRILEMVSDIINIAAHYRAYFTHNHIESNVYLYFGNMTTTKYTNKKYNEHYRNYYRTKFTGVESRPLYNILKDSFDLVRTIITFIEGVYFIQPKNVEPSVIPYHIIQTQEVKADENYILTNDPYEYQYVNLGFNILRPNMENTKLITRDNVIEQLKLEHKILTEGDINPVYIPFIQSFLSDRFRNISGIMRVGFAKAMKMFNLAIDEHILSPDTVSITMVETVLNDEWKEYILNNYNCIDIPTQYRKMKLLDQNYLNDQLEDKFDNPSLKKLNDEYFTDHPLMLMELNKHKLKEKPTKSVFEMTEED